ncbi:protein cornichon4 [Dorcoceras hygrometricum]|uniref:Protein cornichon4 n=1 Tax=Dorcoceras hygrometricum TaxID=472368 RepID=A0A2Z7C539_9LAMI|nr:protein cornichon4 [Dorcoceras hygrometricum]
MCLTDLEFDYINPYDSASRINFVVWPEFVAQGILCFVHLTAGHWTMFLLCLPYLYYNIRVYSQGRHLVDVTEIFNQLPGEKNIRLYKLGYLVILLALSIFWYDKTLLCIANLSKIWSLPLSSDECHFTPFRMIWSIVEE